MSKTTQVGRGPGRPKGAGRQAITLPISMLPDTMESVEKRWRALYPQVANRSHYFVLLHEKDIKEGVLGPKIQS